MTDVFLQRLPSGFSFDMILLEGGTFDMGVDKSDSPYDGKPAHRVRLDAFGIGQYPVTQGLWKAVMGTDQNPSYFRGDRRPVEQVSWEDIDGDFLPKIRALTGVAYRLPTEAEWEYAARGGGLHSTWIYGGSDHLKDVGWYDENSHGETKPVGLKAPNDIGLYDMSGNVWEWCLDWYDADYYKTCKAKGVVENPVGPKSGARRVVRGGSWGDVARRCRATYRSNNYPAYRWSNDGFRLVFPLQSDGRPAPAVR
ncbi:MAG: formylglycine-generating enzyme family protein [Saprospiraceae bacterium]|nr:formylglycine-generating enzyme family protein [Saprospiraceae bacterium]